MNAPSDHALIARHVLVTRTERLHLAGGAQVLTRIENPKIPIRVRVFTGEIDERRHQRQIPGQFRGGACMQPLSLPVVPMTQPINRAHCPDDDHLRDGPQPDEGVQRVAAVVPTERQRQHRENHRHRAQDIDCPIPAPITVAVLDGALVVGAVGRCNGIDERRQRGRRRRHRRRLPRAEIRAQEQHPLNELMKGHTAGSGNYFVGRGED
jgi:hypothetical protein